MSSYRTTTQVPKLVQEALELAAKASFANSCLPEVGRLLATLAGPPKSGCIGEIGTGLGVGAAWIISALDANVSFVTVEADEFRTTAAASLVSAYPNVRVLQDDWHELLKYGPFNLLFADGGKAKEREPELLLNALVPGGLLIVDDLTPENLWTAEQQAIWSTDPVRHFWLNCPAVYATEILVTPQSAVILAIRC